MANGFSKEERVAFEDIMTGFEDYLVLSRNVDVYKTSMSQMERSSDIIWRPMPYIATSVDGSAGTDISAEFLDATQLSVPATIGFNQTVPWTMNAKELRDVLQNERYGKAAAQRLGSDINVALMAIAANQGTLVIKRTGSTYGFNDVAACETLMNETGVPMDDRYLALSTADYNKLAGDLAGRGTLAPPKTLDAYEKAYVGRVASFDTFKLDYANAITLDAMTTIIVDGANQRHVPKATDATLSGKINVDNRTQTLAITATTGTVKVGDCFTMAGVNAVHHITKQDTGNLKTFRIIAILTGAGGTGNITISPPIIAADSSPTDAELAYKNCTAAPADLAAITPLNTVTAKANPFWHKGAMEILPGRLSIEEAAGIDVMRGTTDQGFELVLIKQWDIDTNKAKYRMDCLFGVVMLQPEMAGLLLIDQT